MSAESYECKGSGEIGAAPQDFVGWCCYCKKIQRARVGTGRLKTHRTTNQAQGRVSPR